LSALPAATIADLYRKAGAEQWALSRDEFMEAVEASVRRTHAGSVPAQRELDRYLAGLHVSDLALATACALGRETAWDHFVLTHRPVLYRAADALNPSGSAREIADSLYADLYGLREADGTRRSLFRYFHGRSTLATWLRSVLAQRFVDSLRVHRRTEPLPDDDEVVRPGAVSVSGDPDRDQLVPLVQQALAAAIATLPVKDRLRLRSYYVSELTLAQIGRISGEHEATVSRQLARTRRSLRDAMERHLRDELRLSEAQASRALELAMEDPGGMSLQRIFADERKESPRNRSREEH
jgi:RNA polymerase sigma-70 factor (ECF subfamily)